MAKKRDVSPTSDAAAFVLPAGCQDIAPFTTEVETLVKKGLPLYDAIVNVRQRVRRGKLKPPASSSTETEASTETPA